MGSYIEESTLVQPAKWRYYDVINALLGLLGATVLILMASYILNTYSNIVTMDPGLERLHFQVYFTTILTFASAIILVYGSYLIWKSNRLKGGIINLLAGTLVPIPTYVYFTFLSQPSFLFWLVSWFGPVACFPLAPAIISGTVSILLSNFI